MKIIAVALWTLLVTVTIAAIAGAIGLWVSAPPKPVFIAINIGGSVILAALLVLAWSLLVWILRQRGPES